MSKICTRNNDATRANISKGHIHGEGTFKYVYKGEYTVGQRAGQPCVGKVFKTGDVYEDHFFAHEMDVIYKSLEIITAFNASANVNKTIYLNQPSVWQWVPPSRNAGERVMVEPFLTDYEKFNSNSGWANTDSRWSDIMQALSHFSYHHTGGASLLCDMQGSTYRDGVVLTDPVVTSRDQRFGSSDLGPAGISTFFAHHRCTKFCQPHWTKPHAPVATLECKQGTSMMNAAAPCALLSVKREPY